MTNIIQIKDVGHHVAQMVTLQGWLYAKTGKGKLQFLQIRDGSGVIQGGMFRPNLPPEIFEAGKTLTQESSIIVTGKIKAEERAQGVPADYQLDVTDLKIIQIAGVEFLMDNQHLWIRSRKQWAILRVQATIMQAIRQWLDSHGYLEMTTPIFTPAAGG